MKKVLALLLALVLCFGLFACGNTAAKEEPKKADDAAPAKTDAAEKKDDATPAAATDPTPATSIDTGFPWMELDGDYSTRYKVVYALATYNDAMARQDVCYKAYADIFNWDYTSETAATISGDDYISLLETYCALDYDGFIVDFDPQYEDRIFDVFMEYGVAFMVDLQPFTDKTTGKYKSPCCVKDYYQLGQQQAEWLYEKIPEYIGEGIDLSKIGAIYHDMTQSTSVAMVQKGFKLKWDELTGGATGYFTTDFDHTDFFTSAYTQTTTIITGNTQYEYWVMASCMDFFAQGAARAITDLNLDDKALMISLGGNTIQDEWSTGYNGCWKAGTYTYEMLSTCAQCIGLTKMMGGVAMKDLWPEYVKDDQDYATLGIETKVITLDNIDDYLAEMHAFCMDTFGFDPIYDMDHA